MSNILWKLGITAVVIIWAISCMMPFKDTQFEDFIKTRATADQQGFQQVLAEAEKLVDKTSKSKTQTLYIALREYANEKSIDLSQYFTDINVRDITVLKKRNDILLKELYRLSKSSIKQGLDLQGGVSFTLEINEAELSADEHLKSGQIEKVLNVISDRVNGLGVTEPTIRVIGGKAIEVQMPGVSLKDNPEAIESLSRPAKLEFKLVHRSIRPSSLTPPESEIPMGYSLMIKEHEVDGKIVEVPQYVKKKAEATGEIIDLAFPRMDDANRFSIDMKFTPAGAVQINRITKTILAEDRATGTKQPLAIVLDGKLLSDPVIQGELSDRGQITGNFTRREALDLANALNNPLAVGLKRTSMNEVGPSLAEDARTSSLTAAAVAAGTVTVFMVLYYFGVGIVSVLAVLVNIVIVIGTLASFGTTFTLPGIAALALTVAMAVDANILIFERMREELKSGKTLSTALELGYSRAFSSIIDGNLTTLMVALILWWYGTGPIKGFGVTLSVGIFATLFSALIFSKALMQLVVKYGVVKNTLKSAILQNININFMKLAKPSIALTVILMLVGVAATVYRGDKLLSIDFTGGESLTVAFENKVQIGDILALSTVTQEGSLGEIQASYQKDISTGKEYLAMQVEPEKGQKVFDAINAKFPEAKFTLIGIDSIGASVSSEITTNAFISVLLAVAGILLYVAVRFEIGFGIGAVVSTVHDIILTIGLFVLLSIFGLGSGQFSAPMVAAVLMVIGYSINDTIIVFDRIREELLLRPTTSLYDIINIAINKTLSRTLITSGTTVLAALSLFALGTGIIKDFSLVFFVGVFIGTFSSIFIASPVFYWWHKGDRKHAETKEFLPKYSWQASGETKDSKQK